MDDLTAFINARLDEDEAAAKACEGPSPWKAAENEHDSWIVTDATGQPLIYDEGTPTLNEAEHIARHDPARVLREVEAKRAIMAEHGADLPLDYACLSCQRDEAWPCRTLRLLAAVWSAHPDYKQEWAL